MATWTHAAYTARLAHEAKHATNDKAIARLRQTLRDVERFLTETERDPDEAGWIALLSAYVQAATKAGLRHG
jgi:hypothetical protein